MVENDIVEGVGEASLAAWAGVDNNIRSPDMGAVGFGSIRHTVDTAEVVVVRVGNCSGNFPCDNPDDNHCSDDSSELGSKQDSSAVHPFVLPRCPPEL